jgi:hypothetical protein
MKRVNDMIPLRLLRKCQDISYKLFEDLRQLQFHPLLEDYGSDVDGFMSLVNRRELIGDDPGEAEGLDKKQLIREFVFDPSNDLQPAIDKADRFLAIFDTYSPPNSARRLPPPVWLRLLPICLEVANALELWGRQAKTKLRFMSFAIEPLRSDKDKPYAPFVNINSDEPRPEMTGYEFGGRITSRSLNRALFGAYFEKRLERIGRQLPYVWWGIRFRTAPGDPALEADSPADRNWLDVYVDQRQFNGKLGYEYKDEIIPVSAKVKFPERLPKEVRSGLDNLFRDWAFDEYDLDERSRISLDTPSEQAFAYVRFNQASFPDKKLPESGMDCLICPGVFWSATPLLWGTGMTIVYGFEGYLDENRSNLLLWLTQQLMIAPTVYAQANKIWISAERAGRHNLLHELPGYMDSIGITLRRYEERRKAFLTKYSQTPPEDVPPLPSTDDVEVMVMLLAAENNELRELPSDLAERLGKEWTQEFLYEFVERLVWTPVQGDVGNAREVIEAISKGDFSVSDLASETGAFQRPELKLVSRVNPKQTYGLFPLLLVTLKSAVCHAYLRSIMNCREEGRIGLVTVEYRDEAKAQYIEVKNSGRPPRRSPDLQQGWQRNIGLFKGITGDWGVESTKSGPIVEYSIWHPEAWNDFEGFWLTTLRRNY